MKEKVVFAMLIFTLVGCRDHGAPNSAATPEVATASANQGGGERLQYQPLQIAWPA